jgi:glycosyltransferase involved in cell wall biosynthesis
MQDAISSLSVFFPTYNEEENIAKTVSDTQKVLERVAKRWEIIIVDDGSSDRTPQISDGLARNNKNIRVVHHKVNRGYGGTLKTGFQSAIYPWVAFVDSDGQFDFSEITKFIEKTDSADLILGYRVKRADPLSRKLFAVLWALFPRTLWGLKVRDYSCGFKLIKKEVFEAVQPLIGEEKVTQIEFLIKAKKKGFRFVEIGVHHYPRIHGKQTGANLKVVAKSFLDLYKLWKILR